MFLNLRWRLVIVAVVAFLGVYYMLPSIGGVKQSALGKFLPDNQVNLGLDLKGGIHLTLGVELDKALANALSQAGQDLKSLAQDKDIPLIRFNLIDGKRLEFIMPRPEKRGEFEEILSKQNSKLQVDRTEAQNEGRMKYTVSFTPQYRKWVSDMTVDQAVKTIRNRIDEFGVAEPDIRKAGDRIQVQLPGLSDPDRAIQIIGKTAHLEFKIVDDETDVSKLQKGVVPPGREFAMLRHTNPDGSVSERPILLKSAAVMTGDTIADAHMNFDQQTNQAYVGLKFTDRGAKVFERVTGDNIKKRMAIILDGKVYSAPVIQDKIGGGRAQITGHFTKVEARDLAVVLRAGSLPAPVVIMEQRTVGPSLGQESIEKGVMSAVVAGVLIVLFMLSYYRFSGFVADLALCLNLVLIIAGLAAFGATLTLPGIAGIILTIGMSVDANVIVFERIREEIRLGLPATTSIREGFKRATLTIFDANITTIIAAVVLYQFGTGPIKGFAVTLILGIVASMFTAIFVSHALMDLYMRNKPAAARLSI
ncbi:protein translocase subunit SecD [Fundidesulfovibrio butyratiphilus]